MLSNLGKYRRHIVGVAADDILDAPPRLHFLHTPAEQAVQLDRHQGRNMPPVFEHLTGAGRVLVERRDRVGPEPGPHRQVVRPLQYIDRIELQEPDTVDNSPEMPAVDTALGPRVGKSLRRQGNPAGLTMISTVNVTIKNFGINTVSGLSLLIEDFSDWEVTEDWGDNVTIQIKPINPREIRTISRQLQWGLGSKGYTTATLMLGNEIIDNYTIFR